MTSRQRAISPNSKTRKLIVNSINDMSVEIQISCHPSVFTAKPHLSVTFIIRTRHYTCSCLFCTGMETVLRRAYAVDNK